MSALQPLQQELLTSYVNGWKYICCRV